MPRLTLRSNGDDKVHTPVNVDFVLDVGNSRTCGILIEEHAQDTNWTHNRYELTLRDLSEPHLTYSEPFESRMEFNHASFGLDNISSLSGRASAFNWPTITRIGPEALRLASGRRGMEGSTGLSSPKRYLWDEEPYAPAGASTTLMGSRRTSRWRQRNRSASSSTKTASPCSGRRTPTAYRSLSRIIRAVR